MSRWIVENDMIVGRSPLVLPPLCVKCGGASPDDVRCRSRLHWFPAWVYLFLLLGILPAVLLYYVTRRSVRVEYSLCVKHLAGLRRRRFIGIGLLVAFVAMLAVVVLTKIVVLGLVPAVLFVACLVALADARSAIRVVEREGHVFALQGFGADFITAVRSRPRFEAADLLLGAAEQAAD